MTTSAQATGDRRLLELAERTAAYVARHLPASGVSPYDYNAPPGAASDVSAGATTAAAAPTRRPLRATAGGLRRRVALAVARREDARRRTWAPVAATPARLSGRPGVHVRGRGALGRRRRAELGPLLRAGGQWPCPSREFGSLSQRAPAGQPIDKRIELFSCRLRRRCTYCTTPQIAKTWKVDAVADLLFTTAYHWVAPKGMELLTL